MLPGIHLVHKAAGPTSVAVMSGLPLGHARHCHGGALDPFAEGLLLVLVGEATKLFPWLHDVPKCYEAEVVWGTETDTGDAGGQVVAEGGARPDPASLDAALAHFSGWTLQVPPATSNKRVAGERAWARAHRGETVDLPACRVLLHQARWTAHPSSTTSHLEVVVRGGFYVRALARDLGRLTGARAHLRHLRRSAIGPWPCPEPGNTRHLQGIGVLPWCPQLRVAPGLRLQLGDVLPPAALSPPGWRLPEGFGPPPALAVAEGRVKAIVEPDNHGFRVVTVLGRGL